MNLLQKCVAVILLLLTLGAAGTVVAGPRAVERPLVAQQSATLNPRRVSALTLLGEVRIPSGGTVLGTPFGGLSGLTYNPGDGTYTAISDDRSQRAPARFYHVAIDLADGRSRFLAWDRRTPTVVAFEHVYPVAPWPVAPSPVTASADNGFVDLVALDDAGTFVTLERSFATGVGVTSRLFETSAAGATDVASLTTLLDAASGEPVSHVPMTKRQLVDIGQLGIAPDNLEGMTFGPTLPDGRRVLVLVSDDNFSATQVTQFVALAVGVEAAAARRCYLPLGYTR